MSVSVHLGTCYLTATCQAASELVASTLPETQQCCREVAICIGFSPLTLTTLLTARLQVNDYNTALGCMALRLLDVKKARC